MLNRTKYSNKGFTIIELIIVIAIIAVLSAVVAPQYLRFLERSKEAHDLEVATQYLKVATVVMTDLSVGYHTEDNDWYVFKWGYSTGNNDDLNAHMGVATTSDGRPTGIDGNKRDPYIQQAVAEYMGWIDDNGDFALSKIPSPQSAITAEVGHGGNSFLFYFNIRTGEILVDKSASKWVTELGVNAPLME